MLFQNSDLDCMGSQISENDDMLSFSIAGIKFSA